MYSCQVLKHKFHDWKIKNEDIIDTHKYMFLDYGKDLYKQLNVIKKKKMFSFLQVIM